MVKSFLISCLKILLLEFQKAGPQELFAELIAYPVLGRSSSTFLHSCARLLVSGLDLEKCAQLVIPGIACLFLRNCGNALSPASGMGNSH